MSKKSLKANKIDNLFYVSLSPPSPFFQEDGQVNVHNFSSLCCSHDSIHKTITPLLELYFCIE